MRKAKAGKQHGINNQHTCCYIAHQ